MRRTFARISPNLHERFLSDFCLQIFSHKDYEDVFWYDLQTKVFICVFCKRCAPFFEIKQYWASFLPGVSEILPKFSEILPFFLTNQNFWGGACILCSRPPKPLLIRYSYTAPIKIAIAIHDKFFMKSTSGQSAFDTSIFAWNWYWNF